MISSSSMQGYQLENTTNEAYKVSSSSKLRHYKSSGYQTLNIFFSKNNRKKYGSNKLTMFKFRPKNVPMNSIEISTFSNNNDNYPKISNFHKKIYSQNKDYNNDNYSQRLYTSENENFNFLNLNNSSINFIKKNDYSNYDWKSSQQILNSDFNYYYPSKTKFIKSPNNFYLKKRYPTQNENNENENILNYNDYNSPLYTNSKNDNDNEYSDIKDNLNTSVDDLTNELENNYLETSNIVALSNYNINYNENYNDDEPKSNFKLSDLTILDEIGKGSEGIVYVIRWNKNSQKYAMKKVQIMFSINVKKRKNDNAALRNFIERTGCDGIIKPYGITCVKNEIGFTDCYEIMELAEKDWEKEILNRKERKKYYSEYELMEIFRHLIKTFSLLQKNHITHRDIKPQNIMFSNGKMKICDFGNARVLKRNGVIIQRIRGSELFMSPIVFKGYRSGIQNIRHNAFKSDVYSLGVCFFLAASLSYDGLNMIRQMEDMKKIRKTVEFNLEKRYSANLIDIILTMLKVDENKRPDFLSLEGLFP